MVDLGCFFFFQAEDGIRDLTVTGVQTCALPISGAAATTAARSPTNSARPRVRTRVPPPGQARRRADARTSGNELRDFSRPTGEASRRARTAAAPTRRRPTEGGGPRPARGAGLRGERRKTATPRGCANRPPHLRAHGARRRDA